MDGDQMETEFNACYDFLEECDLCHNFFDLQQIILTEWGQLLCQKCYGPTNEH